MIFKYVRYKIFITFSPPASHFMVNNIYMPKNSVQFANRIHNFNPKNYTMASFDFKSLLQMLLYKVRLNEFYYFQYEIDNFNEHFFVSKSFHISKEV